jgi:hypothetical protein
MTEGNVTEIKDESHILSVDDLVMEIGKMHVEKMGSERHINSLKTAKPTAPTKGAVPATADILQSNKQYEEKNRGLSEAVVTNRNNFERATLRVTELEAQLATANKKLKTQTGKVTRLEKKIKSLTK